MNWPACCRAIFKLGLGEGEALEELRFKVWFICKMLCISFSLAARA